MEGKIFANYFGSNNENFPKNKSLSSDIKENKEIIDSEENKKDIIKEELPDSIEIIRIEKISKIKISEDIIFDRKKSNELTEKLVKQTKNNSKLSLEEFYNKKRHFLIMSDGGKPVYSRYGDPIENNSIFATLSAMITKFTIFNNNNSFKENININANNKNKIVFLKKGH